VRHGTSAWLCLILLTSCIQPAIAAARINNAMAPAEVEALSQGAEALQPCIGEYMRTHPLDDSTGKALIKLGLAAELKARTLAVLGPQSTFRQPLAKLDVSNPEDVGNILYILVQEIGDTRGAVDSRPYQLLVAVFNYYTARLAGKGCSIDPGFAAGVRKARHDRLDVQPDLDFDGLWMQREIDHTALCAFDHFSPHAKGAEQINAYVAEHGDLQGLRGDVEAFTAVHGDEMGKAALARVSASASAGEQLAGYMGVLIGAERSPQLPLANRYRAAALSAYHLARATDGSCKLGKSPLELIGKE
jgi:hypothetical protein